MVKLEPKTGRERPDVNFAEWDSMLRICFNRKNKTLRASWLAKEVLAMVTKNYRIWASLNNILLDESPADDANAAAEEDDMDVDNNVGPSQSGDGGDESDEFEGFDMDVDGDETPAFFKEAVAESSTGPKTPSKRKKTKVEELVKGKLEKVLEETELKDKRARQCDENDFLRLLFAVRTSPPSLNWPELTGDS